MRLGHKYKCDKCGKALTRETTASLSTYYQPLGLVGYNEENMGVRHMCAPCKKNFAIAFKHYFTVYNQIKSIDERELLNKT